MKLRQGARVVRAGQRQNQLARYLLQWPEVAWWLLALRGRA